MSFLGGYFGKNLRGILEDESSSKALRQPGRRFVANFFFVISDFLPQNQRTYLWLLINYVVLEENEVYR